MHLSSYRFEHRKYPYSVKYRIIPNISRSKCLRHSTEDFAFTKLPKFCVAALFPLSPSSRKNTLNIKAKISVLC